LEKIIFTLITLVNIIGISASVFTAISSFPQLLKLVREKKADDISLVMLLVLLSGLALWIFYGCLKEDWILIIANSFSFLLNITLLVLAIIYKK